MPGTTTAGKPFQVSEGEASVTAQKVFTRMGERLELTAEALGASTRLDAIMLESVTWQDADDLAERGAALDRSDAVGAATPIEEEREDQMTISSEFALATVEKTGPARLHLEAPKLGYSIDLRPEALEWLATQDHETFTGWLEEPFGPGADDHDHGH
jgi:hypothetical protein